MRPVSVLCTCPGTAYDLLGVETYDENRDARTWSGGSAVVAHPPCGPWGKLRSLCTTQDATLGPFCVAAVRRWGGVLNYQGGAA
jgi:hypothetical protein